MNGSLWSWYKKAGVRRQTGRGRQAAMTASVGVYGNGTLCSLRPPEMLTEPSRSICMKGQQSSLGSVAALHPPNHPQWLWDYEQAAQGSPGKTSGGDGRTKELQPPLVFPHPPGLPYLHTVSSGFFLRQSRLLKVCVTLREVQNQVVLLKPLMTIPHGTGPSRPLVAPLLTKHDFCSSINHLPCSHAFLVKPLCFLPEGLYSRNTVDHLSPSIHQSPPSPPQPS